MTPENGRLAYDAIAARAGGGERGDRSASARSSRHWLRASRPIRRADRTALDRAYAEAMARSRRRYPDDPDVLTFYADAVMNIIAVGLLGEGTARRSPAPRVAIGALERVIARQPDHRRRAALPHPRARGVERAGARGAERGPPRPAHARRGTHGAHAGAHLHPRRPLQGRRRGQRARDCGRRRLPVAVPGAGPVPVDLLPAQPALPVGGGDARGAARGGDRCRAAGRRPRCRTITPGRWRGRPTSP